MHMDKSFLQQIFQRQLALDPVPSNERISGWAMHLIGMLYPEKADYPVSTVQQLEEKFDDLQNELTGILSATRACSHCDSKRVAIQYFAALPALHRILQQDVKAILAGDPAAHTEFEIIRAYPGFLAICLYRIAHALHGFNVPVLPRILTEYAHSVTGIDIHPAASIGTYFCIDHGTGVVIGETAHIGNHVKIYQGVTLGALSVAKTMANTKRHPTVEDHVVIYSGATILGGETVIGHHSIIGGNVWLTRSVPPHSTVYHKPEISVVTNEAPVA
jgi:serine O-acetyltransferase